MSSYQVSVPPADATCTCAFCGSTAVVRLVTHRDAQPMDICDLHWPGTRGTVTAEGHIIVDVTGDLQAVGDDFPDWSIWTASTGRMYATTVMSNGQGTTVDAFLIGPLRAQMAKIESSRDSAARVRPI